MEERKVAQVPARAQGEEALLGDAVVLTKLDRAIGWARKYSIFPYPFATACCAMEYMALSMTPYDIDRFGALLPRFSPRQADLLMVIGTVTCRQAPILKRVYEQMAEPKWVMAFGACASTGGFYDNYTTVPGIDRIIPVDVYVPGCPPRPEQLIEGVMAIQRLIDQDRLPPTINGRRAPLGVVLEPTHTVRPQPVGLTVAGVGGTHAAAAAATPVGA